MNKLFYIEPDTKKENDVHESIIIHLGAIKFKCSKLIFNPQFIEYLILKKFKGKHETVNIILKRYINKVSRMVQAEMSTIPLDEKDIKSEYVWTMWLQDDVPTIIQMCLDSIKKYYPDVIILNEKTISDYITIPDYILEKYKKGIITSPHFSDYIRTVLLDKYGGIWLDASCFLQNKIPKFISKQDFFILTATSKKWVSNFFITSNKNNYMIKTMRIFLEEYWKTKNYTVNYFFFHRYFELACKYEKYCNEIYKNLVPYSAEQVKYFTYNYNINYDEDLWNYLKQTSFMYKINRKEKIAMENSSGFYQYFLNEWRNENINNNSKL